MQERKVLAVASSQLERAEAREKLKVLGGSFRERSASVQDSTSEDGSVKAGGGLLEQVRALLLKPACCFETVSTQLRLPCRFIWPLRSEIFEKKRRRYHTKPSRKSRPSRCGGRRGAGWYAKLATGQVSVELRRLRGSGVETDWNFRAILVKGGRDVLEQHD